MPAVLVVAAEAAPSVVEDLLAAEGYAVRSSMNITDACTLLRGELQFEAVVVVCGATAAALAACNGLREAAPQVPILVLVGSADVAERVSILDAGASHVLEGAYASAELLARLRALTRRRRGDPEPIAATAAPEPDQMTAPAAPRQGAAPPETRTGTPRLLAVALLAAGGALALDMTTKALAEAFLPAQPLRLLPFLSLADQHEGLGHGVSALALLLAVLALATAAARRPASPRLRRRPLCLAAAAGTLSACVLANLAQLALAGNVTDFIALSHLPVLNVADMLALGALLTVLASSAARARR